MHFLLQSYFLFCSSAQTQICSCQKVEVYSEEEGASFTDENGHSLFGIYEKQGFEIFHRSSYAHEDNEDHRILWNGSNKWIISSNKKVKLKFQRVKSNPQMQCQPRFNP